MDMKKERSLFAVFLIMVFLLEAADTVQACDVTPSVAFGEDYGIEICTDGNASAEDGTYRVNYILNGGVNIWMNPDFYEEEDLPITLHVPARSGYNFAGWYLESNYRTKVTQLTEDTLGDVTLFAKWTRTIDDESSVQMYSYNTGSSISGTDRELKNCEYSFLQQIEIPGMPSTREEDWISNRISDTNQCPQGICMTDDYVMVTAYSVGKKEVGSLHVFDRETGEYLVTLGMKKESHLGGITFDGNSLWVCHSDNQTLERIPYGFVKRLADQKLQSCVDCSDSITAYKVANRPSCITYYDGRLYVATETRFFNSKMIAYQFDSEKLQQKEEYRIPNKVQGVAFDEDGTVFMSTSHGRTKSSYLKVYDSLRAMDEKPTKPYVKVEMPPCSEEIEIADGNIYVLFESAGGKYFEGTDGNGTSISPIDKILAINASSFLTN